MSKPVRLTIAAICGVCLVTVALFARQMLLSANRTVDERPLPVIGTREPSMEVSVDPDPLEDSGLAGANEFMASMHDPTSLEELRELIEARARVGRAVLAAETNDVRLEPRAAREEVARVGNLYHQLGLLDLYDGRYSEASVAFAKASSVGRPGDLHKRVRAERLALEGIIALRSATSADGVPPNGAPLEEARRTEGQAAVDKFTASLELWPWDLRVRWLLNAAYMLLGEYPNRVPLKHLVSREPAHATTEVGRFENVASATGLAARGPALCGGAIFDDLNGDGLADLFATSVDANQGTTLFLNRGDGTFEDRTTSAGIVNQPYVLNVSRADYDNDGDLDMLLVRGGWERPLRLSLLRNQGNAHFDDVTLVSGLHEPIASASACWGDFDNDGWADLFVCGEYIPNPDASTTQTPDSRNRCRLYRNRGNGTFVDVAASAGVLNDRCAQGAVWGDYDNDGWLDLYVSNRGTSNRLYHNERGKTFRDVAPGMQVDAADSGPACWFWDYDNDGRLDLFASAKGALSEDTLVPGSRNRLYRNTGTIVFLDVANQVGLDMVVPAHGSNFADIDNDGYLDVYLGNGSRSLSGFFPNRLLKNVDGERFEDATRSSGTGGLHKAHAVCFADPDNDGDQDFFVNTGGTVPAEKSPDLLFRNPGARHRWLKVMLRGTKTNRAALGARLQVDVQSAEGRTRSIYRTVGNTSTVSTNTLVETFGLGDATSVAVLKVTWPTSQTTQTFRDLAAGQTIEIVEGEPSYQVLPKRPRH
jgi:hypothetical protein